LNTPQRIAKLYKKLLSKYGPQGWWPTTPQGEFLPVYTPHRQASSLSEVEAFEVCLGALLTQNTNWSNVEKVLRGLSEAGLLTAEGLRSLRRLCLEKYLRSSGYFC
jgi:endonuclease-3 related protein